MDDVADGSSHPGDPDSTDDDAALEAVFRAAEALPNHWATRTLAGVSEDGRTVSLAPKTRRGAELWTERPWGAAAEYVGELVRFHEFTGVLEIGEEHRLVRKGVAPPLDRISWGRAGRIRSSTWR